jgi:hypothetical protein
MVMSYKGFGKNLQCRGFQFEVGQTYTHAGAVKVCERGFHACEYPLDVFNYYAPGDSRFCTVEQDGDIQRHDDDSKIVSSVLTVKTEIGIPGLVKAAVEYIVSRCAPPDPESPATNTGTRSAATNTGDQSAATNTGYQSAATNTGTWSAATNTGTWSAATNTGYQSAATNTGDQSAATNTGTWSAATNTGTRSAATNTGTWSAATNTGYQSAATNTGDQSAATNTGYQSAATNTGDQSAATNTGDQSAACVEGKHSVAVACGHVGRAKAAAGSAIVLVNRGDDGSIRHIRAAVAGREIKPDVWYTLGDDGEFQEVETYG